MGVSPWKVRAQTKTSQIKLLPEFIETVTSANFLSFYWPGGRRVLLTAVLLVSSCRPFQRKNKVYPS